MWRSETLTMATSNTSIKVATETITAISHGLRTPAAERGRLESDMLLHPDVRRHRHAWLDQIVLQSVVIEGDLHRQPLHDLHIVAGGIFGRQHAELTPRPRLKAVDVAAES